MRLLLNVLGILSILVGAVWFFQGIGVLPGSFMTGQPRWAVYGGLALLMGIGIVVFANWRRVVPPPS